MLTPTKPVKSCECGSPCGDCCGCTKESIGLGNVDNTSDLNKPLSTAMINALSGKVDLDTFTQLKNRVLALENSIPDITDLEHRMDEAEDDILGLSAGYNSLHNTVLSMADSITELGGRVTGVSDGLVTVGTRVDSLEDEDSNNMKLNRSQTASGDNTFRGRLKAQGQPAYSPSQPIDDVATIGTLDAYAPMVRTTGNQTIGGYKKFEYKPNIASYYVFNANLMTKWVRVCSYASYPTYNDMHCITRFISGHTTDSDFMFDVDIKQRSPAYAGNSALFLVNNASVRPLAINRAPTGTEVGLVAVFRTVDNTERVEIWGKFAGNRLIVTVQNYNIINALPNADGVYKNEFSHDNDGSFITWDLNTYADEPPEGTLTQYLKKGNEAS